MILPVSVYLMALLTKFIMTCLTLSRSARAGGRVWVGGVIVKLRCFSKAVLYSSETTSFTTG